MVMCMGCCGGDQPSMHPRCVMYAPSGLMPRICKLPIAC